MTPEAVKQIKEFRARLEVGDYITISKYLDHTATLLEYIKLLEKPEDKPLPAQEECPF